MAGANPDFDAADFTEKIRFVFAMGAPVEEADQAKFYFAPAIDADDTSLAPDGVPFDPSAETETAGRAPVTVPCGVESDAAVDEDTNLGMVAPSKILVSLMQDDYLAVRGCAYVVVGGERYDYVATDPPSGLFDAGIWTMRFKIFKDL